MKPIKTDADYQEALAEIERLAVRPRGRGDRADAPVGLREPGASRRDGAASPASTSSPNTSSRKKRTPIWRFSKSRRRSARRQARGPTPYDQADLAASVMTTIADMSLGKTFGLETVRETLRDVAE